MKSNLRHIILSLLTATAIALPSLIIQARESVSSMKSQQKEADKEINQIKGKIGENQRAVTENLATLKKIEGDIEGSQKEINIAQSNIKELTGKISGLEKSIGKGEAQLKKLREEYLKAVKKMRVARKKSSGMTFLFASKSFAQAERRMRYMKEFSDWKSRQQEAITAQVAMLKEQRNQLATARKDKDVAYRRQLAAQDQLKKQQQQQTAVVAQLKANGDELQRHLAEKQAEARQLANQISQLIAQEQAREAERKRKAAEEKRLAEQRTAEQRRLAQEQAAREKAAREKAAREKAEQERAAKAKAEQERAAKAKAEQERAAKESAQAKKNKETVAATPATPAQPKENTAGNRKSRQATTGGNEYADARRRRPRENDNAKESTKTLQQIASNTPTKPVPPTPTIVETPATPPVKAGFAGMKGQLPKPVGGSFRIVSAFGKHPISKDLPNIMYDNLGIDAHVSKGATATAVYEGEVLSVYDRTKTPGFRNVVVVKHGDYITVYGNLETVSVHSGQKVKQGQALGTVGADFDDPAHGLIHFEVWQGQSRQNPASWIK